MRSFNDFSLKFAGLEDRGDFHKNGQLINLNSLFLLIIIAKSKSMSAKGSWNYLKGSKDKVCRSASVEELMIFHTGTKKMNINIKVEK